MKRVFLYSLIALVCIGTTSCGELAGDEDLADITVMPSSLSLPVNGTQKLAVNVPDNVPGVPLVWSSADEKIATVDQTGLVTITGVGETTVKVACGPVEKTVSVTGTITGIAVNDADGKSSGQSGIGTRLQLRAIIDPDTGDVTEWSSSDPDIATVDDLGLVTVTGSGIVTVTATVGAFSASYTLSTSSVLDDAIGYWTFDDPANLSKAIKGSDLIFNGTVTAVDGPAAGNIAIEGVTGEQNVKWKHETTPLPAAFSMMWDTRFVGIRQYYAMYWNGIPNSDASFFFRWRIQEYNDYGNGIHDPEKPILTAGRGTYWKILDLPEEEWTPWMRVVFVFEADVANDIAYYSVYIDGQKVQSGREITTIERLLWQKDRHIYFLSDGDISDSDDSVQPYASIAVWKRALTEQEIASLGGVK